MSLVARGNFFLSKTKNNIKMNMKINSETNLPFQSIPNPCLQKAIE